MKEVSVGLSDAPAEEAANVGITCRTDRRVAFIEFPYSIFTPGVFQVTAATL